MESEFPSNTPRLDKVKGGKKKAASDEKETKKVDKVVTGKVIKRKTPWYSKMRNSLTGGAPTKSVLEHVWFEILVPAGKDLFLDATFAGLERKVLGETRSHGRRGYGRSRHGHTDYSRGSVLRDAIRDPRDRERGGGRTRSRNSRDFGEIILETRAEAHEVLDNMYELLSRYEQVTVGDLLDLVDEESNYTDNRFGWFDLKGADVIRIREGYLLELPRPEPID